MKAKIWVSLSLTFNQAGVTLWSLKWHGNNRSLGGLVYDYLLMGFSGIGFWISVDDFILAGCIIMQFGFIELSRGGREIFNIMYSRIML